MWGAPQGIWTRFLRGGSGRADNGGVLFFFHPVPYPATRCPPTPAGRVLCRPTGPIQPDRPSLRWRPSSLLSLSKWNFCCANEVASFLFNANLGFGWICTVAVERFAEPRAAPDMEENGRLLERVTSISCFPIFVFFFYFWCPIVFLKEMETWAFITGASFAE